MADVRLRRTRRALGSTIKALCVTTAACLMIGGDLSYRDNTSREASLAAATLRGGPQPSNTAVRWLIQAQYRTDEIVAGRRITVQAEQGVVTLTGLVDSEFVRARAVLLAGRVRGVSEVQDKLEVERRRLAE